MSCFACLLAYMDRREIRNHLHGRRENAAYILGGCNTLNVMTVAVQTDMVLSGCGSCSASSSGFCCFFTCSVSFSFYLLFCTIKKWAGKIRSRWLDGANTTLRYTHLPLQICLLPLWELTKRRLWTKMEMGGVGMHVCGCRFLNGRGKGTLLGN